MTGPLTGFGPRIRKSPYFEATQRYGCKAYTVYNHMYMPQYYESLEADFWHLVERVTLWDVAVERQVQIAGPDAAAFVQYLTPRDLSKCAVGQCKYVLLTDETGGIVNDPILLRLADDVFWLSLADSDVLLWAKALAHAGKWDVVITEPDVSPMQVQGPRSTDVMRDICGGWVDDLRYFWFRETEIDGIPVILSRTGWSSERGYEVFLRDSAHGDRLWEIIMAAGKPYEIHPGAPNAIRRIEGAMLSYGSDMGLSENPFELGMDRLVNLDMDADFCGKEALKKVRAEGVTRKLVGIEIEGTPVAQEHPWPAKIGDRQIGTVTSAVYSPRLEKNIALAIIDLKHTDEGTQIMIDAPTGARDAVIVPMPFYDPKKALAAGHSATGHAVN